MSNIYIASMGIITNMTKMDVRSNNITNASTYGFKRDRENFLPFEEVLRNKEIGNTDIATGKYKNEVYTNHIQTNFEPGLFDVTDRQFDFALQEKNQNGDASFFLVSKDNQTYLTRNGQFNVDANGYLSTVDGGYILNEQGQKIQIPRNVPIEITKNGSIRNGDTNEEIATLNIKTVSKDHLGLLEKRDKSYFQVMTYEDAVQNYGSIERILQQFDTDPAIRKTFGSKENIEAIRQNREIDIFTPFEGEAYQGALERSNVDMSQEMVALLDIQKGVGANQKAFQTLEGILEKEASDITR